ncbi:PREDICTED: integral membrane protein GPR137C [Rhinopithecus bieti]|uniref:integral membrane protein GPR137C n=1 Tax=Rhinopithecus bieti TaxID=61621 RepID=UPI00083BB3B6|nr:PREDICTED: integral membrane protein GPR137C [Rhinopithecus bieti]
MQRKQKVKRPQEAPGRAHSLKDRRCHLPARDLRAGTRAVPEAAQPTVPAATRRTCGRHRLDKVGLLDKKTTWEAPPSPRAAYVRHSLTNGKRGGRSESDRRLQSPPAGANGRCSSRSNQQRGWEVQGREKVGKLSPQSDLGALERRVQRPVAFRARRSGGVPGRANRREPTVRSERLKCSGFSADCLQPRVVFCSYGAEPQQEEPRPPRGGGKEEAGSGGAATALRGTLGPVTALPGSTPGGGGGGGGAVAAASGAAVPGSVQLALSVLHALLYAALFAFAYLQLWRLLLYRERRLSYQSLCLFLCLLWAALRTTLFSAAFSLSGSLPLLRPPAHLHFFPHWLLYCFPSCLQFSTLCLLNLYLAEVIYKVRCATELDRHKVLLHFGFIMASLLFLVVNLTCAMLVHGDVPENQLKWTVFVRALINDSLFILCAISLVSYICKITKMSSANVYLESKGMSLCQTVVVGSVVILLYSSRACYNLVVVTISQDTLESPFNYGWDNLSDKAHVEDISGEEYIVFGMVLFLWEHVPAWSVVLFFRAQRLNQNLAPAGMINSHSYSSRAYFFDNPRRYDSDDDLPRLGSSREGSLPNSQSLGWYGTMTGCGSSSYTVTPHLNGPMTDTAPLLFTCSNLDLNDHHSLYVTPQN